MKQVSILPNSEPRILQPMVHAYGTLQVRQLECLNDHGLFFGDILIAIHNHGYSCHNLAERIIAVWDGKREPAYAMEQFDYILACGGLGKARSSVEWVVDCCKEVA